MKNENNKKIGLIVGGLIILAVVFYAGIAYGKSQGPQRGTRTGAFTGSSFRNMGGNTFGQIISKDDKSITVSLMSGGSKIIFLDTNTKVSKQVAGTAADLTVGGQVAVMGTPNTDGSINAQSIQIRPNIPQSAKVQ